MGLSEPQPNPVMQRRYEAIYELVRQIPVGQVATYGQIGDLLGLYGHARQVGYAMFRVPPDSDIPWHRVINAQGMVSRSPLRQGSDELQRILLEQEGIVFDAQDRIDLQRYRWSPPTNE
jgi:methylated-DNA-protein-cysteine methyltransferase related protein